MPLTSDHSGSKPRNKLRKLSKPRPGSVISTASPRGSTDTPRLSTDGHGARISPSHTQQQLQTPPPPPPQQQQQQQQQQSQSQSHPSSQQHQQALLHPPPDLSSPKWEDYVTNSSFPRPMEKSPRLGCDRSRSPCKGIPELAHLTTPTAKAAATPTPTPPPTATTNTVPNGAVSPLSPSASPAHSAEELLPSPRKSSSSTSSSSSSSSTSSSSPSSSASRLSLRTYAKTPVLRVGQLEECGTERRGPPPLLASSSPSPSPAETGVEVMAEQYRALLAPPAQTYEQFSSDLVREWEERQTEEEMETRQHSIETIRSAITRRSPLPRGGPKQITTMAMAASQDAGAGGVGMVTAAGEGAEVDTKSSPASDTTLVDFEEDAIYFKPAFTPEALSPIPEDRPLSGSTSNSARSSFYGAPAAAAAEHINKVLGLQMGVNLLTRELARMTGRDRGVPARRRDGVGERENDEGRGDGGRSSLLQIWIMIEAYERLRSQVREMEMPEEQREALEDVFGTWLEALERVGHDMAMVRVGQRGYKVGGGDGGGTVDMVQGMGIP